MEKGFIEGWYRVREETQKFSCQSGAIDGDAQFSDFKGNLQKFLLYFFLCASDAKSSEGKHWVKRTQTASGAYECL
jgi:hypothetical protein